MDFSLIAASFSIMESPWVYWPIVALGLGMVIFIHEMGHFLVAKYCGVKCEKFYVGFDIPIAIPLKIPFTKIDYGVLRLPSTLWKRQWGETEYGIGILPLGGYVKMLGQDDNPYNQEAELDRARADGSEETTDDGAVAKSGGESPAEGGESDEAQNQDAAAPQWDPRSYMAKTVPQRMAILSAGVIMNVILCFVLSVIAYPMGVPYEASIVGSVSPGGAAWYQNIPVGAEFIKMPRFNKDVRRATIMLRNGKSINVEYYDPRTGKTTHISLTPKKRDGDKFPLMGITASLSLTLSNRRPTQTGSPASEADFKGDDQIVAVKAPGQDLKKVSTFAEFHEILTRYRDKTLEITVKRKGEEGETDAEVVLTVKPMPMLDLGLSMKLGKITDVQPGSPAAEAGIESGDEIVRIERDRDNLLTLDPMTLPNQLRRLAGEKVTVTVRRDGKELDKKDIVLRQPLWAEDTIRSVNAPMSAPALGIAYIVHNQVADVRPNSPASKLRLKRDDKITAIKLIQPEGFADKEYFNRSREIEFVLDLEYARKVEKKKVHWPMVVSALQLCLPDTTVQLTVEGQDEPIEIQPQASSLWFSSERGLNLDRVIRKEYAKSFTDALRLGLRETWESITMVVQFIQRISDLWQHAGGPITIANVAASTVQAGLPTFLVFLAMLSANLAVINILPIPVLDGGHLVFLSYEGIRGKPPSEKVFIAMNLLGLAFILCLMVFVFALDIGRLME